MRRAHTHCACRTHVDTMTRNNQWRGRPAAAAETVKGVSFRLPLRPRRPVNPSAHHVHPSWTAFAPPRFPTCAGNAGLMPTLLLPLARSGRPASHLEPGMYRSLFPHPSVLGNFQRNNWSILGGSCSAVLAEKHCA